MRHRASTIVPHNDLSCGRKLSTARPAAVHAVAMYLLLWGDVRLRPAPETEELPRPLPPSMAPPLGTCRMHCCAGAPLACCSASAAACTGALTRAS